MSSVSNQRSGIILLDASLAPGRIRQFLRHAGFDPGRAQALHDWNEEIGSALYRPLQKLELAMRARIGQAFGNVYGAVWYQDPQFRKDSNVADRTSIADAIKRAMADGLPIDAETMMAKSSFGLCVGLLRPIYNPAVWSGQLRLIFPNLPPSEGRHDLAKLAANGARLRNRIDHHDPLVELDLSLAHADLLNALAWIDPLLEAKARADKAVQRLLREKP